MSLDNATFSDPTSTLLEIGKMKYPSASDLAIVRAIQVAPAAARDWESRVEIYLRRATEWEERNSEVDEGGPTYSEGWMYAPLVFWPSNHLNFIADVLAVVQEDITATVVLPSAYDTLRSRINTLITSFYPDGSGHYYMLAVDGSGDSNNDIRIAKSNYDSRVHPDNYTDDDEVDFAFDAQNGPWDDVVMAVNNLIFHIYEDDDDVDLTKGGEFVSLVSFPICLLYVIMNYLRNSIPSGTGDEKAGAGTFLSTAEWNALTSAASQFLTN